MKMNVKYLNKDLLYSIDMLEDDDVVNVIISLKSTGLVDSYNDNNQGYRTLNEFASSRYATSSVKTMNAEQQAMVKTLIDGGYINEVKHNFTTLFNGFSATTTYGQLKALEKAGFDINVSISEVYSEPEYNVASVSNAEVSKGDTVTKTTKSVEIETGATIQVPLFIQEGDLLKIDTRTGEYLERINEKK